MLKQAEDFYEESKDIHYILKNISEDKLNTRTQFKSWSFTDIIRHLHVWNIAAYKSLEVRMSGKDLIISYSYFLRMGGN